MSFETTKVEIIKRKMDESILLVRDISSKVFATYHVPSIAES